MTDKEFPIYLSSSHLRSPFNLTKEDVVELLSEMKKLMELRGENPFKIRAFEKAISVVGRCDDLHERARAGTLTELSGIGKGIADVLSEYILFGVTTARDSLRDSIPPGLVELSKIRGVGPKKAMVLINELGIHSISELEYACKENRLVQLKGFGQKFQELILAEILFRNAHQGMQKLSDALEMSQKILSRLKKIEVLSQLRISETGGLRRRVEILSELEYLVEWKPISIQELGLTEVVRSSSKGLSEGPLASRSTKDFKNTVELEEFLRSQIQPENCTMPVRFYFSPTQSYGYEWARTTATEEHWKALGAPFLKDVATEEQFYQDLGLPWMPPEARELGEEVELARAGNLKDLLPENGIRGIFHIHTTRSDGNHTLEEMVEAAEDLGYEYIGISDHSQTAFYAQGLKMEAVREQKAEVQRVQEKHPKIRIFWGIESDILADGSLDYDEDVLREFDFVVASVHSRFQMDGPTMTDRILNAIRNPYTRFLGHPTGRLLLGRKSYEVDMKAIIQEAANRSVAMELNSNPARLDIDWRWGSEIRRCSAFVAVNPDAHSVQGLRDVQYGVMMARKALLSKKSIVNTRSVSEVEKWLKRT